MLTPPPVILQYLTPFSVLFSRSVWGNALVLVIGAILAKGKRTVTSCLRFMGLKDEENFPRFHWVLSHAKWSSLTASRILLGLIVKFCGAFTPLTLAIDETLERRKGKKIKAKGYYRDAVRSSEKNIVKCMGLKWMTLTVLIKLPWSERRWALPFMTVLEPSEECDKKANRRHKTSIRWSIQMLNQVRRWLPTIALTLLADGGFATAQFCWECIRMKISLVSRFRKDTRLYDFPAEVPKGTRGRRAKKGNQLMSFKEMAKCKDLPWQDMEIKGYGGKQSKIQYLTNVSLWCVPGFEPIPVRWVLIIDPTEKNDPLPLFSTNFELEAKEIIELFIERWSIEVTFEEVRAHLGVETQRQWSDGAIARTTPALMGLFSLLSLMAAELLNGKELEKGNAAWYQKEHGTFSDVLTVIRKEIWFWKYTDSFVENEYNSVKIEWLMEMLASATG
jgi:hypothetical protein